MSKTIKIIILVSIFCFGAVLLSGCALLTGTGIEKTCCEDCLDYILKTPGAEKCLDNQKISKECREFFTKNPDKEKECLEGATVALPGAVFPGKENYDELKAKYENKKWRGTLTGEQATNMAGFSCTQTYTARIDEMRINFDAPESGSYTGLGGHRISIDGNAVLESAHISCTCAELNVEISSFPFKLDGAIDFPEGTINFNAEDPEADKDFKVLYVTTCDPGMEPFYGDDEPLFSLFEPKYTAFKFDGDKITLTSAFGNLSGAKLFPEDTSGILKGTNTKETISGELNPF